MSAHHEAMARLGDQLTAHWRRTGQPIVPMDQIDYSLCEDGTTICIDWYLTDGFNAMTFFTPERPGAPLPCSWARHEERR